jgi:hypothetical protein
MKLLILNHCEGLEAALQGGLQAVNGGYNIEAGQAGQEASYQPFQVNIIVVLKEIGDEETCYSIKISIFSFIWAGLAALHEASTIQ